MSSPSSQRRSDKPGERNGPGIEKNGAVWTVRSATTAKQILTARYATTQAGFTSEAIPRGYFRHHPILISDGPLHDEQRKKVGRFFAPRVVEQRHRGKITALAKRMVAAAGDNGSLVVDELALLFTVDVTRQIVGLDRSGLEGLCRRLVRFFSQPPADIAQPGYGRTRSQWMQAAVSGLLPLAAFYVADVRPALRHHRRSPGRTVIDHLIAEGYSNADILVEAVTFGTAGMVTTREFVTMAMWHLLDDPLLHRRYLHSAPEGRRRLLEEILRLEPVVGHLYRRVQSMLTVVSEDESYELRPGDLVDIQVRHTNIDERIHGANAQRIRAAPTLARGHSPSGLSFSDGSHACPGKVLALSETEILVTEILRREPRIERPPSLGWDNLIEGYMLRGMRVELTRDRRLAARRPAR